MGFPRQEYWRGLPFPSPISWLTGPLKRKVPYWGLSIGLCCQQSRYSALVRGSLCCYIHTKPPWHCLLHLCAQCTVSGEAESRGCPTSTESSYTWLINASSAMMSLVGISVRCRFRYFVYHLTSFSHTSIHPISQLCSFQVHDQPVNPFAIFQETVNVLISGNFSLHKADE